MFLILLSNAHELCENAAEAKITNADAHIFRVLNLIIFLLVKGSQNAPSKQNQAENSK